MSRVQTTSVADTARQGGDATRWAGTLGAGLLAGLVAALAMTLLMGLARLVIGLPTPAELIGDAFIPSLNLDQFFMLLIRFGGGNGLKRMGIGSVLAGQLVAGTLLGVVYAAIVREGGDRSRRGLLFLAAVGGLAWLVSVVFLRPVLGTNYRGLPIGPATIVTTLGLLAIYTSYGVALVLAYRSLTPTTPVAARPGEAAREAVPSTVARSGRRAFIVGGVAVLAALLDGALLRLLYGRSTLHYDGTRYQGPDLQPIAPSDRFYTVTKNILDPDIAHPVWRLAITGMVERAGTYSLADLTALPATTQEATLSCISNDVGDGLSSNAIWTGVPLRQLLETAGPRGNIARVVFTGADNYVDTIPLDKALDPTTFVAWEMNGAPLPKRHGYPVRILVPGRFGEKSVKWVTRIALAEEEVKGFYERQGWGPTFVTNTFSRFDVPGDNQTVKLSAAALTLKGIAFAGDRGISRVEVSSDDGRTWEEARLDYQQSRIVWTFWSVAWRPPGPGEYRLAVRAVDGTGAYQTSDRRGITPDGATGYHRITVQVAA